MNYVNLYPLLPLLIAGTLMAQPEMSPMPGTVNAIKNEWFQNTPSQDQVLSASDREYTEARNNIAKQKRLLTEVNEALEQLKKIHAYGPEITSILSFDDTSEESLRLMLAALTQQSQNAVTEASQQMNMLPDDPSTLYIADIDESTEHEEHKAKEVDVPEPKLASPSLSILFAEVPNASHPGKMIYTLDNNSPETVYQGTENLDIQLISVLPHGERQGKLIVKYVYAGATHARTYPL